jgi:hypothetical protein
MNDELPIELECFLLKYGFLEPKPSGWIPSYPGEDPPF